MNLSRKKIKILFIFIVILFVVCSLYFFTQSKNDKIFANNFIENGRDNLVVVLDNKNKIHLLNPKTNQFLPNDINVADSNIYGIKDIDFSPNGLLYISVSVKPDSYFDVSNKLKNIKPHIAVVDINKFSVIKKIETEMLPDFITFASNGTGYLVHGFEYKDGSGWAVSILDSNTNQIIGELKLPGSPFKPKLLEDDNIYIPIMGGGKQHFGNSNVIVINPHNNKLEKLFDDDFTEVPVWPLYFDIKENILYSAIFAKKDLKRPIFNKPTTWNDASNFLMQFDKKEKNIKNIKNINIDSSADYQTLNHDNNLYISYHNSLTCKNGGILIYDLIENNIVNDIKINNINYCSKSVAQRFGLIYISEPANKSIMILDTNNDNAVTTITTNDWIPLKLL